MEAGSLQCLGSDSHRHIYTSCRLICSLFQTTSIFNQCPCYASLHVYDCPPTLPPFGLHTDQDGEPDHFCWESNLFFTPLSKTMNFRCLKVLSESFICPVRWWLQSPGAAGSLPPALKRLQLLEAISLIFIKSNTGGGGGEHQDSWDSSTRGIRVSQKDDG